MKFMTKQKFQRLGAALAAASLTILTGCSKDFFQAVGGGGSTGTSSYAYITHSGGALAELSLTSGALAALSGSPVSLSLAPTCIAISPNNANVYVGTADGVFLYTRNSDGTLTEGNDDSIIYLNQSGYQVESMTVDSTSSWLLMTYQNHPLVEALPLDPTTGLAGVTVYQATLKGSTTAPTVAMTPGNGSVLLTMGATGTEVIGFTASSSASPFASSGTVIAPTSSAYSATAVAADPTSAYLYITEANTSSSTAAGKLRFFATASLSKELTGSPYSTGLAPIAVLPDKSGAYVYVANNGDNTLSGFTVNTTSQTLTAFDSTIPTGKAPIALAEDSSKTYIYSIGGGSNPNLYLYNFDSANDGTLDIKTSTSTLSTSPASSNGIAVTN